MSNSTLVADKAKLCLELLAKVMRLSMEQKKRMVKDGLAKDHAEESLRLTEQRLAVLECERKPEMNRILELVNEIQKARKESDTRRDLEGRVEAAKSELEASRAETERIKDRLREAMATSTRNSMHASQLVDELNAAKQQAAKAERNAVKEARKAAITMEEKVTLSKRCEQLEKQLAVLRDKNVTASSAQASSTFRVRPLDDAMSKKHGAGGVSARSRSTNMGNGQAPQSARKKRRPSLSDITSEDQHQYQQQGRVTNEDNIYGEFDFR